MKVRKAILAASLSFLLLPFSVGATSESFSPNESKEPIKLVTENLNYGGEDFELVKWQANDGSIYYTIPTEVKNKEKIAEYANNYVEGEGNKISTRGTKNTWTEVYENDDRDGRIQWSVGGFNEDAYLYPITANRAVIEDGNILTNFYGSGNADKIIVSYSYVFNGTTVGVSYPPSLNSSSNKVYWSSSAITNQWYVSTKTYGAEGSSRTLYFDTDIEASADIYKGPNIYRPRVTDTIGYPYK